MVPKLLTQKSTLSDFQEIAAFITDVLFEKNRPAWQELQEKAREKGIVPVVYLQRRLLEAYMDCQREAKFKGVSYHEVARETQKSLSERRES